MVAFEMNCIKKEEGEVSLTTKGVRNDDDEDNYSTNSDATNSICSAGQQTKNFETYMALLYQQFLTANLGSHSNNGHLTDGGGCSTGVSSDCFNYGSFINYLSKLALLANISKSHAAYLLDSSLQSPSNHSSSLGNCQENDKISDGEVLNLKCHKTSPGPQKSAFSESFSSPSSESHRLSPLSSPEDLSIPKATLLKSGVLSDNFSLPLLSFSTSTAATTAGFASPFGPYSLKRSKFAGHLKKQPDDENAMSSTTFDPVLKPLDSSLCTTNDIARMVAAELRHYGIPQALFSQRVLGRSQGTLSDLLRNPKPWSKLKAGRETFKKMLDWLNLSEPDRLAILRFQPLSSSSADIKIKKQPPHDLTPTASSQPPTPLPTSPPTTSFTSSPVSSCHPELSTLSKKITFKKPRLVFTEIQRRTLSAIFREVRHPSRDVQATIAEQLNLKLSTVSNFFMNARRRSVDKYLSPDSTEDNKPCTADISSPSSFCSY